MDNVFAVKPVPLQHVHIQDAFWSEYIRLVREVVVPYQWEALNDRVAGAEPSHAIQNYRIAAGLAQGEFYGMVFQDSDVAKWLEAVGHLLAAKRDAGLESLADEVIEIIAKAQQADGYVNTYFTIKAPGERWSNLAECHELYCAGHLIEAAVAYYEATGKSKLLEVACRLADCIDSVFGPEPGKLHGYDGHQEIELALVKLYHATGNGAYLRLSQYFLDERGRDPDFYETEYIRRGRKTHFGSINIVYDRAYSQAHLPVREQTTAEGHAVRVVYMCAAMADVAAETGDEGLLSACRRLWGNIVSKRMYITGAIGSMAHGESFSLDYDLPGDTAYAETCASIGLIFFARRMLQLEARSEYADVMERALYNTVISGMSRDGRRFFYVNPLEVWPEACGKNKTLAHVKPERQGWFGCACCPPNIARLLASLGSYIYTTDGNTLYTHLYVGSTVRQTLGERQVTVSQQSALPWEGTVRIEVTADDPADFRLALRIPSWCGGLKLRLNGEVCEADEAAHGYAFLNRTWRTGDVVELELSMPIHRMKGHPLVRATIGKTALQRGPLVYCLEEADNGSQLHQLYLLPQEQAIERVDGEAAQWPDRIPAITVSAHKIRAEEWGEALYQSGKELAVESAEAVFIPYFCWANRGRGEMSVWVKEWPSQPASRLEEADVPEEGESNPA